MQDVIIIGSGFGGLGLAIKLKERGIDNFVILERAANVGGTWRDNSYPGAACDVQSHLYSYSFAPNPDWPRKYSGQAEILAYINDIAERYDLKKHIRFNAEVIEARYDVNTCQWAVATKAGDFSSQALVSATGTLSLPLVPNIPGLDEFEGEQFHSATWNHDYDLTGKQVAVIGTGASAIQFVPQIVPKVKQLHLLQRSPAWVIPKADRRFFKFEKKLFRHLPGWRKLYRWITYWSNEWRVLAFKHMTFLMKVLQWQAKRHIRKGIKDQKKREQLLPNYTMGCKRILISNDYYPALNQEHVHIRNDGIERITASGIQLTTGEHLDVDAIVLGTGFKATQFLSPIEVIGKNNISLNQAWQDGVSAYKGMTVSGFPNFFILYGPHANLSHSSIIYMHESQYNYILQGLDKVLSPDIKAIEVKKAVQQDFDDKLQASFKGSVWSSGCTSWYLDENGRNTTMWPGSTLAYRRITRHLDDADYNIERE